MLFSLLWSFPVKGKRNKGKQLIITSKTTRVIWPNLQSQHPENVQDPQSVEARWIWQWFELCLSSQSLNPCWRVSSLLSRVYLHSSSLGHLQMRERESIRGTLIRKLVFQEPRAGFSISTCDLGHVWHNFSVQHNHRFVHSKATSLCKLY